MAIAGLRDTAASLNRLSYSVAFGKSSGDDIRTVLNRDLQHHEQRGTPVASWIRQTCVIIGSKKEAKLTPPPDTVAGARETIVRHVGSQANCNHTHLTKIDAPRLEAWRAASKDTDDQVGQ